MSLEPGEIAPTPPEKLPETPMGRPLEMVRYGLIKPVSPEKIKKRKGAGTQSFNYLKGGDVKQQLIAATNNTFDWIILEVRFIERETFAQSYWQVHGRLTIPGLGSRDGVGTAKEVSEDGVKGADTDAMKRAAVNFGVALQLYCDMEDAVINEFRDQSGAVEPITSAQYEKIEKCLKLLDLQMEIPESAKEATAMLKWLRQENNDRLAKLAAEQAEREAAAQAEKAAERKEEPQPVA